MRLKAGKTDKTEKRQPDSKTQTSKNSRKNNREFTVITYAVLVLFVCMMGYFAYFQFVKSEDFINSPYNKRQDLFARKVTRNYFCRWPHTRRNDHRYGWDRDKILSVCQYVCACRWFLYQRKVRTGIDC